MLCKSQLAKEKEAFSRSDKRGLRISPHFLLASSHWKECLFLSPGSAIQEQCVWGLMSEPPVRAACLPIWMQQLQDKLPTPLALTAPFVRSRREQANSWEFKIHSMGKSGASHGSGVLSEAAGACFAVDWGTSISRPEVPAGPPVASCQTLHPQTALGGRWLQVLDGTELREPPGSKQHMATWVPRLPHSQKATCPSSSRRQLTLTHSPIPDLPWTIGC